MSDGKPKMETCPFCDSRAVRVVTDDFETLWRTKCISCNCFGPSGVDENSAIECWNKRKNYDEH